MKLSTFISAIIRLFVFILGRKYPMPRVIGCSSTGPEARKREQVGRGKKEGGKRRKEKERAKQRWRIGFDLIEIGGGGGGGGDDDGGGSDTRGRGRMTYAK
jgi:hypothetical protein